MHWLREKMHKLGCALESPRWLGKTHMPGPQGQSRASGYLNLSRRFQGAAKFEDHGTREVEIKNTVKWHLEMDGDVCAQRKAGDVKGSPEKLSPSLPSSRPEWVFLPVAWWVPPVWRGWRLSTFFLLPAGPLPSRSPEGSALGQGKERELGNFLSSSSNQQFWSQIRLLNLFTSETQTLTCLFFSPGLTHRVSHSEPC